jgi:hypothetical protein
MPVISAFFGIIIRIYHSDHNPPHFHAQYGEHEVIIEIKSGRVLNGKIPVRLQYLAKKVYCGNLGGLGLCPTI